MDCLFEFEIKLL